MILEEGSLDYVDGDEVDFEEVDIPDYEGKRRVDYRLGME